MTKKSVHTSICPALHPLESYHDEFIDYRTSPAKKVRNIEIQEHFDLTMMLQHHMARYRDVPTVARVNEITHMPLKTSPAEHELWCIREVINQMDHHEMAEAMYGLRASPRQMAALMSRVTATSPVPLYWINQFSDRWRPSDDKPIYYQLIGVVARNHKLTSNSYIVTPQTDV